MRLELLQRPGQVQEGLGSGAHGHERMAGDGAEIGRHVARDLGAAVDAADAAGGEHRDAGGVGQRERGRDGRGAVRPALGDGHRKVALGRLAGRAAGCARARSDRRRPGPRRRARPSTPDRARRRARRPRQRSSASALAGSGSPRLEKIVDSSATTAPPPATAVCTSRPRPAVSRRRRPAGHARPRRGEHGGGRAALPARAASTTARRPTTPRGSRRRRRHRRRSCPPPRPPEATGTAWHGRSPPAHDHHGAGRRPSRR